MPSPRPVPPKPPAPLIHRLPSEQWAPRLLEDATVSPPRVPCAAPRTPTRLRVLGPSSQHPSQSSYLVGCSPSVTPTRTSLPGEQTLAVLVYQRLPAPDTGPGTWQIFKLLRMNEWLKEYGSKGEANSLSGAPGRAVQTCSQTAYSPLLSVFKWDLERGFLSNWLYSPWRNHPSLPTEGRF